MFTAVLNLNLYFFSVIFTFRVIIHTNWWGKELVLPQTQCLVTMAFLKKKDTQCISSVSSYGLNIFSFNTWWLGFPWWSG